MGLFHEIIAVLVGGAFGSMLRFLFSRWINTLMPKNYPWGIWVVNITGCFVMGIITSLFLHKEITATYWRIGIMVGVLGGYTTFSSFSLDTITLLQNGQTAEAITYVLTSVLFSLGATFLGFLIVNSFTAG